MTFVLARVLIMASLVAASACGPAAFECLADDQCALPGLAGTCESDGWCSFPDAACPSGSRYGEHAGDGKAGTCVGEDGSSGIADTGSTSPGTTMSGGATVTSSVDSTSPSTTDSTTATSTTTENTTTITTTITTDPSTSDGGPVCGNGVVEADEACDDQNDNQDDACTTLCMPPSCGDTIKQSIEVCDSLDFGGASCASFGLVDGTLACSADCSSVDYGECEACEGEDCPPYAVCGDGFLCSDGVCVGLGDGPSTCLPPCVGPRCPNDGFCTTSFDACALPCDVTRDCPDGMSCTGLPNGETACMW